MKRTKLVKPLAATAIGTALMVWGASAFADDTAALTVKGNIIPSACVPTFSGGGVVDFGTIKTVDLNANNYNNVGTRGAQLTISCQSEKAVVVGVSDNQSASSLGADIISTAFDPKGKVYSSDYVYGLGATNVDGKQVSLGSYVLSGKLKVDGANQDLVHQENGTWQILDFGSALMFSKNGAYGPFKVTSTTGGEVMKGRKFIYDFQVTAVLNKGSLLALNEEVPLNGNATFTITYW